MIISIIAVVVSLSFLIFIHELGHFIAARRVNVHVIEFSIGFPPKVVSRVIGKTEYLISLIPIGGYVRLKGQGIEDEDPTDPENYASKTVSQRLLILVSGPLMNLLVTLVLMPVVFYLGYEVPVYMVQPPEIGRVIEESTADRLDFRKGDRVAAINDRRVDTWKDVQTELGQSHDSIITITLERGGKTLHRKFSSENLNRQEGIGWIPKTPPVVGAVAEDSPAEQAGLVIGDRILQINETAVDDWSEISPAIQSDKGSEVVLQVERDGNRQQLAIKPEWNESQQNWIIGINSQTARISESLSDAVILGFKRTYTLTVRTFEFLYRLIAGKEDSDSVGGPIMIARLMGEAAQTSLSSLLTLVAFISLQFSIFNLLPIPALDGGHILFLLIEKIRGRSLSKNARMSIQRIGFSLLIFLILFISIQDSLRLFN